MSGLLHRLAERTVNDRAPRMRSVAPIPWLGPEVVSDPAESVIAAPDPARSSDTARSSASIPERAGAEPPEPAAPFTSAAVPIREVDTTAAPTSRGEANQLSAMAPTSALTQPDTTPSRSAPAPPAPPAAPGAHPAGAWRVPVPLLAPRSGVAAEAPRTDVAFAAAGTDRATEVHVHIARVELTAVPAPSPTPQRTASKDRPGRSLDEYLRQRKERSR
jgi:hypothetical protein